MKGKSPYIILISGIILIVLAGLLYITLIPEEQSFLMLIPWAKEVPSAAPKISLGALPSMGELSQTYPQLAHVLRDAELGSIFKDFLILYEEDGQEQALLKATEWGLLTPDGKSVRVTLVLDTEEHKELTAQLEAVGVTVVSAYANQINVGVPLAIIVEQLESDNPGAVFLQLSALEHVISVRLPQIKETNGSIIDGEGIAVISADEWHQVGYTGEGIRIGVLDLGFAGYEDLLGEELPDQVGFAQFGWYDADEVHGAACAEIIHEVAPHAPLFFAWYDGSDPSFGDAVEWLMDQNVDIISHSAGTPVTSRDGQNFDATIVDDVVAEGVLWVNSSGNDGDRHYRATFNDQDDNDLHEFENGEETLPVYNKGYVEAFLVWEDNWDSAGQDFDLAAYDQDGNLLDISRDIQDGSYGSYPTEVVKVQTDGDTIYIAVISTDTSEDVLLDIFVRGYNISIPFSTPQYSVGSPGDARGSLTVGATSWRNDTLEPYSSQGPTTDERLKPDISAPAGISGATYGSNGFDGTSASTPHVAAAAALVWQAHPEYTRQEVIDFLLNASLDLGASGPDTGYGFGRLQLPSPNSILAPSPTSATEAPTDTPTTIPPSPTPTSDGPGSILAPRATATQILEPIITPVVFSTMEPEYPQAGNQVGRAALLGILVLGPGCGGTALVLVGIVTMIRSRKTKPREPIYEAGLGKQEMHIHNYQSQTPPPLLHSPPLRKRQSLVNPPDHIDDQRDIDFTQKTPQNVCPKCGTTQKLNAHFCRKCGTSLVAEDATSQCPHCGNEIKTRSRFCPRCGKSL